MFTSLLTNKLINKARCTAPSCQIKKNDAVLAVIGNELREANMDQQSNRRAQYIKAAL